jgi:hypothetical protein
MRKLSYFLLVGIVAMLAAPAEAVVEVVDGGVKCAPTDPVCQTDLIAGQNITVGTVDIFFEGTTLRVVFNVDDGNDWFLTETHLYVGVTPPTKSAPGQLGHKHEDLDYVKTDTYEFTYAAPPTDCVYFAAHAVVERVVGYEFVPGDLELGLPDQVQMKVAYPYGGASSYFFTTVAGGTILDGTYGGWCIDTANTIGNNTWYTANVYSSLEEIPGGTVDYPENLDKVNWILNQGFVGTASGCGDLYTYGDVQRAIWALIDDTQIPAFWAHGPSVASTRFSQLRMLAGKASSPSVAASWP